MFEFLIIRITI